MIRRPSLILALALTLGFGAQAKDTDFQQTIQIDAGSQFVDGKSKTSILKDNVRIAQGSLLIEADEAEVIASEGKGNEIFIARGNPATYTQIMDDGSRVSASAREIKYQVNGRKLSLTGQVEFDQAGSRIQGDSIVLDMDAEQLTAEGGEGRVTTVFQPEAKARKDKNNQQQQNNPEPQEP